MQQANTPPLPVITDCWGGGGGLNKAPLAGVAQVLGPVRPIIQFKTGVVLELGWSGRTVIYAHVPAARTQSHYALHMRVPALSF